MITKKVSEIVKYNGFIPYVDRNLRNKRHEPYKENRLFVPMDKMNAGDKIEITVCGDDKKQTKQAMETTKTHMSLVGGYLGIFIKHQILWKSDKEVILTITHDGSRKKKENR